MGQISLGVLRGYSDSTTNEYGNFNVYFNYESIIRADSGKSETVTFKNCYITAIPAIANKRYTFNTLYIDSVYIGNTSLGISGSWVGCEYWYTKSDGSYEYKPKSYTSSKVTKSLTVARDVGALTATLYGHRSGQTANSQILRNN